MASALLDELAAVVGAAHVLRDPEVTASAVVDWTGRVHGSTPAVVRPGSTDEVAAVPRHGEIVVDLRRLDEIGPVDTVGRQVTVGAGATVAALHEVAAAHGLTYAVDFAARDSATI